MTDKELQDKFLGKVIRVPWKHPMGVGCGDWLQGTCKFIGHNPHLPSWELQVTIERTPISNIDFTQIQIIEPWQKISKDPRCG